jgi:molecular chaperone DnaK
MPSTSIRRGGGRSRADARSRCASAKTTPICRTASGPGKAKESQEVKNHADSLAYQAEKNLTDFGDKIDDADKQKVQDKVIALRSALLTDDIEDIRAKTSDLEQDLQTISQKLYEQSSAQSNAAPTETQEEPVGAAAGGEEVIDAEFNENKEE